MSNIVPDNEPVFMSEEIWDIMVIMLRVRLYINIYSLFSLMGSISLRNLIHVLTATEFLMCFV